MKVLSKCFRPLFYDSSFGGHHHPDLLYVGGTGAFEFTKVYVRNHVRILPTRYNIIGTTGFLPKTGVLVSCPDGRLCLGTKF